MQNFLSLVGILAGIFSTLSYFFYIKSILNGNTKPNKITWLIWSCLGIIIALSYSLSGATTTIWVAVGEAAGPTIIAILALKYADSEWNPTNKLALAGAIFSGVIWFSTKSPVLTLLSALFVDFMAALPTLYKSYKRPETEDRVAWYFTAIGSFLNVFAIDKWSFVIVVYPLYMLIMNTIITGIIHVKTTKDQRN